MFSKVVRIVGGCWCSSLFRYQITIWGWRVALALRHARPFSKHTGIAIAIISQYDTFYCYYHGQYDVTQGWQHQRKDCSITRTRRCSYHDSSGSQCSGLRFNNWANENQPKPVRKVHHGSCKQILKSAQWNSGRGTTAASKITHRTCGVAAVPALTVALMTVTTVNEHWAKLMSQTVIYLCLNVKWVFCADTLTAVSLSIMLKLYHMCK